MKKDEKKGRSSYKNNDNIYIDEKYTVTFKKKSAASIVTVLFLCLQGVNFSHFLQAFSLPNIKRKKVLQDGKTYCKTAKIL